MTRDLIEQTRPTEAGLATEWTPAARADVLRGVLAAAPVRHHGRRWLLGSAAAGVAAAVGAPLVLPGWFATPAAAAQLEPVALAAGLRPALTWGEGQFLHVRTTSTQDGPQVIGGGSKSPAEGPASPMMQRRVFDDWRAPDGWTWSRRDLPPMPAPGLFIFPPAGGWMSPGYAATMPTEPHLLDVSLRSRVSGSTSQDEAVFVAVGDMLREEAAPAEVRAAAIRVLGLNPKVSVETTTDPSGRAAVRATFVDEAARRGIRQSLYLDPKTGVLLAEESTGGGWSFRGVITVREVVDALPADVAAKLGTTKVALEYVDGKRVPIDAEPGEDPTPHPSESYTPYPSPKATA